MTGRPARRAQLTMRRAAAVAWVCALVLLSACTPQITVTYVPEGGSYTADDLDQVLDAANLGSTADLSTEEAPKARQEALASLRLHGDDASALADSLTRDFPVDVASVPVVVERGEYEGAPAWIVVEAWGDAGEQLAHRRVWVFSFDTRDVIAARSAL